MENENKEIVEKGVELYNSNKERISTIGVWGFVGAARGVRRSFRSIEKCDSIIKTRSCTPEGGTESFYTEEKLGEEDLKLMTKLVKRGTDEAKFARAIHVQADIRMPLSWWKQFDTYKVGTVRLSDSTMHNIMKDPITEDCFAAESVLCNPLKLSYAGAATTRTSFCLTAQTLEMLRIEWWRLKNTILDQEYIDVYGQEKFDEAVKMRKESMDVCWRQIIDMLPDSYLMESTVDLNYQVIRAVCKARDGHKLDEWKVWMDWAEGLPYADELIFSREGVDRGACGACENKLEEVEK